MEESKVQDFPPSVLFFSIEGERRFIDERGRSEKAYRKHLAVANKSMKASDERYENHVQLIQEQNALIIDLLHRIAALLASPEPE